MKAKEFLAWAIDTKSPEGHNLIGCYWGFNNQPPKIPVQFRGCQVALFQVRKLAREALPCVRISFPEAQAVKVIVEIREAK